MPFDLNSVALVIPTLNAEANWAALSEGIKVQNFPPGQVLIIDSSSEDQTLALAQKEGFRMVRIPRSSFSHGGTRQTAVELLQNFPIYVFMTQDAILCGSSSIKVLVNAFESSRVGAAFGRQLPRRNATPIEAHARLFNYPARSSISAYDQRGTRGFKTIFISNSFAAYRRTALEQVRGFPSDVIFGEDTVTAARLLKNGWLISYVSEATVIHSHHYSLREEFKRCFDIGVLHSRESSLFTEFGGAAGEGCKFVLSELTHLCRTDPRFVPSCLVRTVSKLSGYKLGRQEAHLPRDLKRKLSMHKAYWGESEHPAPSRAHTV